MISIIIPTYNKPLRLTKCLKNILSCNFEYKVEIIVVNDGLSDLTNNILNEINYNNEKFDLIVINPPHCGRAQSRNLGAKKATYDILLFLDDDILINVDVVNNHIKLHEGIDNRVVHGRTLSIPYMKIFTEDVSIKPIANFQNPKYKNLASYLYDNNNTSTDFLDKYAVDSRYEKFVQYAVGLDLEYKWVGFVGANTSIKKSFFQTTGGFDSAFGINWGGEDLEYGYRLCNFFNAVFIYDTFSKSYHLDHYESNRQQQHKENMRYFRSKYSMDKNIDEVEKILNEMIT